MPCLMLVSVSGEDKVASFLVEEETGRYEQQGEVRAAGRPGPMTLDPSRRFLFVGCRGSREIQSFSIDSKTGDWALASKVLLEADPVFLSTDRTGRFLFSAYYYDGIVGVHAISKDGSVGFPPVVWLHTAKGAHSIQTDTSNEFAFVPHIAAPFASNVILQFRFNDTTGQLTPSTPHRVVPGALVGPRHFCFHPNLDVLYFCNEQGSSVTAYSFAASERTLRSLQTVPTVPAGFEDGNTCADICILPSGKHLYATNRGHNSIACYSVDSRDGQLIASGHLTTEPVPRSFCPDPNGLFLFVIGQDSGRLASYRIDTSTGELSLLDARAIGKTPMWVLVAALPE